MEMLQQTAAGRGAKPYNTAANKVPLRIPSLFDDEYENDSCSDSDEETAAIQPQYIPINDAITSVPRTYTDLLGILLPRLQPRPEKNGVPFEEQQELSRILLDELAGHFWIIQHQINDPFLSPNQNTELHRRILVKVCSIIEHLYRSFLSRLSKLNQNDAVSWSSSHAHTRLKAELMVQVNKSLDIPLIRRNIIQDLRGTPRVSYIPSRIRQPSHSPEPSNSISELHQVKLHHPKLRLPPGYNEQVTDEGLHTIVNEGGVAQYSDRSVVTGYSSDISSTSDEGEIEGEGEREQEDVHGSSVDSLKMAVGISYSAPVLPPRPPPLEGAKGGRNTAALTVEDIEGLRFGDLTRECSAHKTKLGEYTDEMLRQDVMNLVERNRTVKTAVGGVSDEGGEDLLELSPLLAASGYGLSKKKLEALKRYLSKLEDELDQCHHTWRTRDDPDGQSPRQTPITDVLDDGGGAIDEQTDNIGLSMGDVSLQESSVRGVVSYTGQSIDDTFTEPELSDLHTSGSRNDQLCDDSFGNLSQPDNLLQKSEAHLSVLDGRHLGDSYVSIPPDKFDDSLNDDHLIDSLDESLSQKEVLPTIPFSEPQPETISLSIPNMEVARISGHRVCERSPKNFLRLQPFPPFYNELCGELDDSTIEEMDMVLQEGDDIQDIYKELSQTLQKDHLDIFKDPFLEPHIHKKIKMSSIYASNSLQRRKTLRVINDTLAHHGRSPPWQGTTRREWLQHSLQKEQPKNESVAIPKATNKKKKVTKKQEEPVSTEDFQIFLANQGSDFLGVVHHMYNSSGSDSEDEERERKKQEQLRKLHLELQEKEKKRLEMLERKTVYKAGQWNTNTVLMGGLGKAPENNEGGEEREAGNVESVNVKDIQAKLEVIWDRLQVSATDRIDMTIVYSDPAISINLPLILNLWEQSCDVVEKRESCLGELEEFEKKSSSASRYFNKGSSFSRTYEETRRSMLHHKLDAIEKEIVLLAKKLRKFKSTLTYQRLDYLEKMSMDRIELLYYLHQQQRREVLLPSIKYLNKTSQ